MEVKDLNKDFLKICKLFSVVEILTDEPFAFFQIPKTR
jgi:hypothetical protein